MCHVIVLLFILMCRVILLGCFHCEMPYHCAVGPLQFALLEPRGTETTAGSFPLAQFLGEFNATDGEPYILKWDDKASTTRRSEVYK
jgi:hypothetical protein